MIHPLVTDLADEGVPVVLTCRVLGFSRQAYFKWRAGPITQRDWDDAHLINAAVDIHHDHPEFASKSHQPAERPHRAAPGPVAARTARLPRPAPGCRA